VITLRALSALLSYPRGEMLEALPEIGAAIAASDRLGPRAKERIAELIGELRSTDSLELEERYVELFDRGRWMSLYLFEHVHGDSRERGQAMVDLKAVYERAGFRLAPNELPDYLPAMLEYLGCRTLEEARDMLADCAHVVRSVGERLLAHGSRYAAVLDALLSFAAEPGLDWSKAPGIAEPASHVDDEDWTDAPAFDPGSAPSQPGPPGVVPLRYMPRTSREAGG
jgi:nitrate reductase delta subunit